MPRLGEVGKKSVNQLAESLCAQEQTHVPGIYT